MDFGNVFSRAWRVCWNNKYLFILGFLAALGSAGSSSTPQFNRTISGDEVPPGFFENMDRLAALVGPLLLTLLCVGLVVGLILWLVRLVAQAGLISAAARLDAGEKVSFGDAFSAGTGHLLQFVGLNLALYLPFWIVGATFAAVGFAAFGAALGSAFSGKPEGSMGPLAAGFGGLALCFVALVCILVPLWIVVTVIYAFAQRGVVVQGLGVVESIGHGWRFVKDNVGDVLLLIVLLVALSLIFGFVVSIIMVPLGLVAFGPSFLIMLTNGSMQAVDVLFLVLGGLVLGIVGSLLNSLLVTYRSVTVTLAYQELLEKPKAV
jgi:hypothetical protein